MKISNEFSGLSYCLIIKVHCFCCSRFYRSSLTSIPQCFVFVKHFFWIILIFLFFKTFHFFASFRQLPQYNTEVSYCQYLFSTFFISEICLKKERRKRDLNPRAGCPTYTLSRGASSASWVFLHFWSAFPRYSVIRRFLSAHCSLYQCFCGLSTIIFYFSVTIFSLFYYIYKVTTTCRIICFLYN